MVRFLLFVVERTTLMHEVMANRSLDVQGGSGPSLKNNTKTHFSNSEASNPKLDKKTSLMKFEDQKDTSDAFESFETELNLLAGLYMSLSYASNPMTLGTIGSKLILTDIGTVQSLKTLDTKDLSGSNLLDSNAVDINLFASMKDIDRPVSTETNRDSQDRQRQVLRINDASWKSSLSRSVLDCIASNGSELELVVLPKTLGKINIQLATSGDTINIKIGTDNANTAAVLNSALSDIEKLLSEGGIKLLSTGNGWGSSQHNNDKKSSDLSSAGFREREDGEHEDIATSATKEKLKLGIHPGNYDYEV